VEPERQSEELTKMKRQALIQKNPSAVPLKTLNKLQSRDSDADLGENISSDAEGMIKLKSCESKPSIIQSCIIGNGSMDNIHQPDVY
jgi:hypothetical protein